MVRPRLLWSASRWAVIARGNMTTAPRPSNLALADELTREYDSRHRLTEVKQGEAMVAKEYDGLNGRVERGIGISKVSRVKEIDGLSR